MSRTVDHRTVSNNDGRPRFSVVQAAARTGAARSTIQRHLRKGAFPNAHQLPDGTWQIPVTDLLGAGFRVDAPTPADEVDHGPADAARVAALESQLAQALARAAAAEAVAAERERIIEVQDRTLRMLTAGRDDVPAVAPSESSPRPRGLLERVAGRLGL